jgi:flagellar hook assembly protein FlgD
MEQSASPALALLKPAPMEVIATPQSASYPNPFSKTIHFYFSVLHPSQVTLTLYDGNGKVAAVLLKREYAAGSYVLHWDARNLPQGVYYYRLATNDHLQTGKLVHVR